MPSAADFSSDEDVPLPPTELKVRVTAGRVNLFLTLSSTLLEKCLDKAVLSPFIKAYNKKERARESIETLVSIQLSGGRKDSITRMDASTLPAASVLGSGSNVALLLHFQDSATTICVDAAGLLALRLSSKARSTSWSFADAITPPLPPRKKSTSKDDDETRAEMEATAAQDFATEGGECGGAAEVADAWRVTFARRRLVSIVRGARSALAGRRHDEADGQEEEEEGRSLSRKKDAPDPADVASVRRFVAAQAEQAALSKRRSGHNSQRSRKLVAAATQPLPRGHLVWEAPASGTPAFQHPLRAGSPQPRHPLRRAVVDSLATPHECAHAICMAVVGIDGAIEYEAPEYNGEATLAVSPLEAIPPFLGPGSKVLVSVLLWRVLSAVRTHFGEARPLYVSGALLTRLQPPPRAQRGFGSAAPSRGVPGADGDHYDYDVAHVDRANVASYDYSAVLYLNGKQQEGGSSAGCFRGGDFCFVDDGGDEVVEPRPGRCVLFPSGFEQLHRVCRVEGGNRFALAVWFTLDATASDGPVDPAPFEMVDPVPRPSREEAEVDAVNIDELRSKVERKMETDNVVQQLYNV